MKLPIKVIAITVISIFSFYILSSFYASMTDNALLYHLELSDPSTYSVTCHEQLSSKWKVSNKQCILETSNIIIPKSKNIEFVDLPLKLNINSSGNLDSSDYAVLQLFKNNKWYNIDSLSANKIPAEPTCFKYFVKEIKTNSTIKLRLIFNTTSKDKYIELYSRTKYDFSIATPYISGTSTQIPNYSKKIDLLSFTGKIINGKILIEWITNFEFNNHHFSLEKSYNGIDFKVVNEIKGLKYSNKKQLYSVFDELTNEPNIYYRLKQTDFENNKNYYDITYVRNLDSLDNARIKNQVYPNPCFGKCLINNSSKNDSSKYLNFLTLDAMGYITTNKILKSSLLDSSSISLFDSENNFKPGVYIVHLNKKNTDLKTE